MSTLIRRASNQLLSARSVHLRIQPRPANLSESREILRVLHRFGDISTYKYLRYEYHSPAENIALAIYRDASSAQQALNASPIRFALESAVDSTEEHQSNGESIAEEDIRPQTPTSSGIEEMERASPFPLRSSTQNQTDIPVAKKTSSAPMPFETPTETPKTHTKWFQVTVDRSRVIHQDYVERQPFWKQFAPTKSMAQEDLAKIVPHVGLSDVSKRPLHHHRTPNKVLKMMSHYVEHVMPSLKEMYQEGGREKKK